MSDDCMGCQYFYEAPEPKYRGLYTCWIQGFDCDTNTERVPKACQFFTRRPKQ